MVRNVLLSEDYFNILVYYILEKVKKKKNRVNGNIGYF